MKIFKRKLNQVKHLSVDSESTIVIIKHISLNMRTQFIWYFLCNLCGYKATNKSSLTTHKKSKLEGIQFFGSKCDKQFTQKGVVRRQIQSHYAKKYQSKACNYHVTRKSSLNTHVKSKYMKQKYPCNDCSHYKWLSGNLSSQPTIIKDILVVSVITRPQWIEVTRDTSIPNTLE